MIIDRITLADRFMGRHIEAEPPSVNALGARRKRGAFA
jgi:hypothetical protein